MSSKKKPTGLKKVRYGYARAWAKPQVKLLHLFAFVLVFGWLGYHVLFSKAESPIPTASDQIVAYYDTLGNWQAQMQADGSVTNILPAGDIIVAGDGSLYCNTNGNGVVTKSNIGLGVVKQIYDSLNSSDVHNAVIARNAHAVDPSSISASTATISVYSVASGWALSNSGETNGVFSRSADLLQHKCQAGNNATPVATLPFFTNAAMAAGTDAGVSWLSRTMFTPAAAVSSSYTATETGTLNSWTNSYRVAHYVPAMAGNYCLFTFTASTGNSHGASPWTHHMAYLNTLMHDPNLSWEVTHCSNNTWSAYGQNVGTGPSISLIWNAYLNSPAHKANILYSGYNKWGEAVYIGSDGSRWTTANFARW